MGKPLMPWPHSGRATPPCMTPRQRPHLRINRQAIQFSEPKRCSEKPSHLSTPATRDTRTSPRRAYQIAKNQPISAGRRSNWPVHFCCALPFYPIAFEQTLAGDVK